MTDYSALITEGRKASRAVYLATDAAVADDLSRILLGLADALESVPVAAPTRDDLAQWFHIYSHGPVCGDGDEPQLAHFKMADALISALPGLTESKGVSA